MEYKRFDRTTGKTRNWNPHEESGIPSIADLRSSIADLRGSIKRSTELRVKSAPSLKAYSMFEIHPPAQWQGWQWGHHTDAFTDNLTRELGLKSKPPVRWFGEIVEGVKSEPGWITVQPSDEDRPIGMFDWDRREVWVKYGLPYNLEKQVIAHEFRHCWQFDNLGVAYFKTSREAAEADADAYGKARSY